MKRFIIISMLLVCVLLVGCTNHNVNIDESKFNIVTSFYPMYVATSNIIEGASDVTLENMTDVQVGCLHDYQMTTKDMNKLEKCDVFVVNGGGMESFLDKATSACENLMIINASEGILEDVEHEEHDEQDEHEHHHEGEQNAHIWVSISLYIEQVKNIANELAKVDTNNAEVYLNNAEKYITCLEDLKKEMHEKLDGLANRNIVTFHEAFEYFAEEFDLNVVAIVEREPGTSPSAGEIAQIIDEVKEKNASAIFVEPQYEKTAADVIARETGVPVYTLDPVVTGDMSSEAYEKIMRENLEVLVEALK